MSWLRRTWRSSIGAKVVMALTGILLFLFVIAHLVGNLLLFSGPEALNEYAQGLRDLGPLLWVARIGLLVVALLHVATALKLTKANEAARPVAYIKQANRQVRVPTKSMVLTGLVILAYVLYHLAHFTWGFIHPQYYGAHDAQGRHDVYSMVVRSFGVWWVALSYVVAMALLALHLSHGIPSFFQTLGLNHAKYAGALKRLGPAVAAVVFLGYASMPLAVWLGFVGLPAGAP